MKDLDGIMRAKIEENIQEMKNLNESSQTKSQISSSVSFNSNNINFNNNNGKKQHKRKT